MFSEVKLDLIDELALIILIKMKCYRLFMLTIMEFEDCSKNSIPRNNNHIERILPL